MSTRIKLLAVAVTGIMVSLPVHAVDLVGVHDLAVKSDPQLKAAEYRLDAAGENRSIARANLLPQISADGTLTQGDVDFKVSATDVSEQQSSSADINTTGYGLSLFQTIYDHRNYKLLDIARGQISQAEATYQIAYQDFLLRVAERYFLVLTLTDGVTFAEAEEKAFQRQFEQAEQRFEVGLTAVTDVHEARASYDNARARAIVARNDLADAKEALRELTGEYFETFDALQEVLPLVEPDPINADEWVDMALQTNPFVLSARYSLDIAESTVALERSGHYPTLGFSAGWDRSTDNEYVIRDDFQRPIGTTELQRDNTAFRLLLDIPIYQGGRVNARTRQARYLLDATGQDLDDTQRGVVRETQNSYRAVLAGIQEVQAFEQASISAESALEATQAGFEVGTRTIVDVLIAEQRKFQAQRDNSVARHAYILRHLRLKSVAGMLTAEDLVIVNQLLQ